MKMYSLNNIKRNDGSILFIVLVVMSLLIILASVLYYSVNSESQFIYEEIRTEQAYQSALSVSDWVFEYFKTYTDIVTDSPYSESNLSDGNKLLYQMTQLNLYETLTTGKIPFPYSFDYQSDYEYFYEITIERIEGARDFSFNIIATAYIGKISSSVTRMYSFNR